MPRIPAQALVRGEIIVTQVVEVLGVVDVPAMAAFREPGATRDLLIERARQGVLYAILDRPFVAVVAPAQKDVYVGVISRNGMQGERLQRTSGDQRVDQNPLFLLCESRDVLALLVSIFSGQPQIPRLIAALPMDAALLAIREPRSVSVEREQENRHAK